MLGIDGGAIRDVLRRGTGRSLRRRRWIAALGALGVADFTLITLYQIGVIRRLPDLPGRIFDSNRVNASEKAYATGVPDGTTGLLAYAMPMLLAAAGGTGETGRHPAIDVAMTATIAAGAAAGAHYLYDMAVNQKRVCMYCVTGAALHFAMLALAGVETRESLTRRLGARPARSSFTPPFVRSA